MRLLYVLQKMFAIVHLVVDNNSTMPDNHDMERTQQSETRFTIEMLAKVGPRKGQWVPFEQLPAGETRQGAETTLAVYRQTHERLTLRIAESA